MPVENLNRFPLEYTEPIFVDQYFEHFENISDSIFIKSFPFFYSDWEAVDWDSVSAQQISDFAPNAFDQPAPGVWLVECKPIEFIRSAFLLLSPSDNPETPIAIDVSISENDLFTEFLIPLGEFVPAYLSLDDSVNMYSAIRTAGPESEDYNLFSVHDDSSLLSEIQSLGTQKKAVHIWGSDIKSNNLNLEIPGVSDYIFKNHKTNRDALPYLLGNGQDFDGLTNYNHLSIITPEKDTEQLFVFSFDYTPNSAGQLILGGIRDNLNDFPHYQFNIVPAGGVFQMVMRANWTSGTTTQNAWRGSKALKNGYNCVIIHFKNYLSAEGVEFYINGIKDNISLIQLGGGISAGTSFNVNKSYSMGRLSDLYSLPSNLTGSYFNGSIKTLQWLDITGQTIDPFIIKSIHEQQSAKNVLDFTNAVLDVDFSTNPISDNSRNNYSITTFNGLTQSLFL